MVNHIIVPLVLNLVEYHRPAVARELRRRRGVEDDGTIVQISNKLFGMLASGVAER